jgi:hypothetical protein
MKVKELANHEKGILNLFENPTNIKQQFTNHNRDTIQCSRLDVKDYDQIFDREPTFNEKKAFVRVFRHKWM